MALVAVLLTLASARLGPPQAHAQDGHPGLNFWIAVDGVPDCNTQNGDTTCNLAPDSPFVVDTILGSLPSDFPNYFGFDIYMAYEGVGFEQEATMDPWPDCGFPASFFGNPNSLLLGCAAGVGASPSTYTGVVATSRFTCGQSGSVSLRHGVDVYTDLQNGETAIAEASDSVEKLTINCVAGGAAPPTPTKSQGRTSVPAIPTVPPAQQTVNAIAAATATALATATPPGAQPTATPSVTPAGSGSDGSSNTWVIVVVVVVIAVAAGGGLIGWRYLQRRSGNTGGS
jgi:hypothetical protein